MYFWHSVKLTVFFVCFGISNVQCQSVQLCTNNYQYFQKNVVYSLVYFSEILYLVQYFTK